MVKYMRLPTALAVAFALVTPAVLPASVAADSGPIKIAVITDMSGVYAALAGKNAVAAVSMQSIIATTDPRRPPRRAKRTTAAPNSRST